MKMASDFDRDDERRSQRDPQQKEKGRGATPSLAPTRTITRSLRSSLSFSSTSSLTSLSSVGCPKEYADKRTMTPFHEKINAVTMLPASLLCLYYMFSGQWIRDETIELAKQTLANMSKDAQSDIFSGCINWSLFPNLPYAPPLTILAISMGTILHCPCSFIYHWKYASNPNPTKRLKHWSRRLDHSAIHACSILWSYAVSGGSVPFSALNFIYNADCIRCHWEEELKPRRNQLRILGSMLLYTSPLLFMQDDDGSRLQLFRNVWTLFLVGVWFFAAYPIRGWSHAAFHIVMFAVPPLLLEMAADSEAEGEWSLAAAQCAVLKSNLWMSNLWID